MKYVRGDLQHLHVCSGEPKYPNVQLLLTYLWVTVACSKGRLLLPLQCSSSVPCYRVLFAAS